MSQDISSGIIRLEIFTCKFGTEIALRASNLPSFARISANPGRQRTEYPTRRTSILCARMRLVLIFALDTCDARGSIALLRDEVLLHAETHTTAEDYSSWLLPAVMRVLTATGLRLADIELYAVAAGPGSFTGVRVGLTTVKAWSEVYGCRIAAASRLEAVAAEGTGSSPFVAAFIDARRNQIFAALYRRQGALLDRIEDEMVIAPDKFLNWCAAEAGPGNIDWVSTDPDCLTQSATWSSRLALNETVQEISTPLAPRIGRIGYNLALQNRLTDALTLDANYVRRSDAEVLWKGLSHHGD
jgi:tRNA threonylcarbamoyladenosine biosynthesis protein TsaB